MKLNFEIEIDAPLDEVWAAFTNHENMVRWMQNLESFNHVSGVPGQPGAVTDVTFDENGKTVVLKETITERRDPDILAGTYDADHGTTAVVNHFVAVDDNRTKWTSWVRFSFNGFLRFMAIFIRSAIRKRTEGDMNRFKLMVESDLAGNQG